MMDSSLSVDKGSDGKFVWIWLSPNGAEHRGHKRHSTKKAALADGQAWLNNPR